MVARSFGMSPARAISRRIEKLRRPNCLCMVNNRAFLRAVAARDASSRMLIGGAVVVKSEVSGEVFKGAKSSSSSGMVVGGAGGDVNCVEEGGSFVLEGGSPS